jgi:hypothetical protein
LIVPFPQALTYTGPSEIAELVASMQAAVEAADRDAYLALVDLSDPRFALEHTRWADDWAGANPVDQYVCNLPICSSPTRRPPAG